MAKSWRLALVQAALLGGAIASCDAPEKGDAAKKGDEQTTQERSAFTTSLFDPYVAYATGSRPEAVAIGDLDGDGRNDIALLTSTRPDPANDLMVHVFLQDVDGTLKPRVKYPVTRPGSSLDIGDVNGDGRADVIVGDDASSGARIGVLLQNTTGTLDALVSYTTPNAYRVKVADFNGDGRMDVACLGWGGTGLDVFLQTDTGTLASPVTYTAPHDGLDELDAGDVNGDGRTDAVITCGAGGGASSLTVLLQMPDGTMGAPTSYSTGSIWSTRGVAVGDTNGDGRSDIVVSFGGNKPDSFIGRFLQNGQGALDPQVSYASYDFPSATVIGDVDGDGRKDVLVNHGTFSRLGVYRQYPSGDFIREDSYTIPNGGTSRPQSLAVGDISGDGRLDAVAADINNGLIVLRHVQDVSLALAVTSPVGGPYYAGAPLTVRWTAGDVVALAGFDVSVSFNNGSSYTPIAGCTGLPATATECPWTPTVAGSGILMRVTARDGAGATASAEASFNVITASITLFEPFSSAQYISAAMPISWSHNLPSGGTVLIELSRDGGASYETLAAAAPMTTNGGTVGTFTWTVTGPTTSNARLRLTANGPLPATVSRGITISAPPTTPVGVSLTGGVAYTTSLVVGWLPSSVGGASTLRIDLSRDGGATFQTIAASAPNGEGVFRGSVPGPGASDARVRVTANGPVPATGTSDSFTLVEPIVTVTSPAAGATVVTGTSVPITWSTNLPATSLVFVQLSRDGGSTWSELGMSMTNTGTITWNNVQGPATSAARVKVTLSGQGSTAGTSDTFAIAAPSLSVTSPAAGATAYIGTSLAITWSSNLPATSSVAVALSWDGGSTYTLLASSATNTGSLASPVPGPATSAARVRVTVSGPTPTVATSDTFSIAAPSLSVTSPAAGSTLYAGTTQAITWSTNLPPASSVSILLSRDGGSTFESLAGAAPNTGSFGWVVTGPNATSALIRVAVSGPVSLSRYSGSFSIATPSLTVTGPAATAYVGTSTAITWTHTLPASDTVRIEISRDGGAFATVAAAAPNTGSFAWNVTGPDALAQVRVTSNSFSAATGTSASFAVVTPSLTVTAPVGGTVVFDSWLSVAWTSTVASATSVLIELSRDGGATFQMLAAAAPSGPTGGVFSGSAFGPDTPNAVVRVTTNGPLTTSGISASFAMLTPSLTVASPAAGAALYAGAPVAITWSTNVPAPSVSIELSRDGGGTFATLAAAAPNTGSFAWTATGPDSSAVIVRVAVSSPASASGNSGTFAIATPSLTVTGPAAGAVAYVGAPVTITWTHNLSESEPVSIELSRDGGATFALLAATAPNTGSFLWAATGPDTAVARVRVAATGALAASHVGAAFQITTPTLAVTSPAAGASWAIGTARTISWSSNLAAGTTVRVDLSRDGGATWTALASASPASGSLAWTATSPATTTARVRVTANGGVPAVGTSGAFTIGNPTLSVTSPTAGLQWTIGAARTITWTTNLLPTATVKIELTRNGGSTYTTLASAAPNSGSFAWTATGPASTTAKVRVSANGFTASSTSSTFSLVNGSVTVTSPNTAVTWTINTVHAITWTHNAGAGAQFKIEVSRSGVWSTITSAATAAGATSGSYNWTVVGPKSTNNAKVRVTWNANTAAQDSSNVSFTIN